MIDLLSLLRQDSVELVKLAVAIVCLAIALSVWRRSRRNGQSRVIIPLLLSVGLTGCTADLISFGLKLGPLGVETKLTVRELGPAQPTTTQPALPTGAL